MNILLIKICMCILITNLFAYIPKKLELSGSSKLAKKNYTQSDRIASNTIIDIAMLNDSLYLFGTAGGLSHAKIISYDSIYWGYFNNTKMPRGGNPALVTNNNYIAVSGVIDTSTITGIEPKGTGIAYSRDYGKNWNFISQPIDQIPLLGGYHSITWGGKEVNALAVTTKINNVSYDLAIHDSYVYSASWAGGLRRYPIGLMNDNNREWEVIPLPRDDDLNLYCNNLDTSYYLNPRDPNDGGFHNHKAFSIYIHDDIIWVGTAAGINKGIINGNCIDWIAHYSSWRNNISGDWVIGFTHQEFENTTRIWAITWSANSQGEFSALSYTDDDGNNWKTIQPAGFSEKVYNIFSYNEKIWAATESGLYVSKNGIYWEKYNRPQLYNGEQLFSESTLAVFFSNINNWLWVGTEDGIGISNDDGNNWIIHRFWEKNDIDTKNIISAYPNPFFINDYNQVNSNGYVRFLFSNPNSYNGNIHIFDFSMDKVVELNNPYMVNNIESEAIWNGRNEHGNKVANGVYFCRLSLNGEYFWTKLVIIN